MALLGSRSEIIVGAKGGRRTGLIWLTTNGAGASVESHTEVLIADLSTQVLGQAKGATLGASHLIPRAANDREDNTGV